MRRVPVSLIALLLLVQPCFAEDVLKGGVEEKHYFPFSGKLASMGEAKTDLPFRGTGQANSTSSTTAMVSGWELGIIPARPPSISVGDCIIETGYWDEINTPQDSDAWNRYGEKLLHMIFANLKTFMPTSPRDCKIQDFTVYVRNDKKIMVKFLDGGPGDPFTADAVKQSIEALNGLESLTFPAKIRKDTVKITAFAIYKNEPVPVDEWGRSQAKPPVEYLHQRREW